MLNVLENTNEEISSVESAVSEALASADLASVETEELISETVSDTKEWPEGGMDSFTDYALPSLLFGMLGIFIVLGLIALATMGLNKLFPGNKQ